MKDMRKITPLVEELLTQKPETRDSDHILFYEVCKRLCPIACSLPFGDVINKRSLYGVPNLESISRIRRKVQMDTPELRASKKVEDGRYENFKEVLNYVTE